MSTRNIAWLAAVVAVGVIVWIAAGPPWGIAAAAIVLIASEVFERERRKRLRAARGETGKPSLKDAVATRRRRR